MSSANLLLPSWAHVDINSYFATLLQQENPALRGRPVGVVKDAGRTCIIAASKEAKARGVATGCLLRDARQLVPELVVVPAHFEMSLSATKKLQAIFESMAPRVDIFSLDEAFIDLSDCRTLYPTPWEFGRQVQQRIKQDLGEWVTCNVGLSYNRLLAKMTSEVSPKGSITEVTPENRDALLASVSFAAVCGVGYRLGARLERLGVKTPYEINLVSDEELQAAFGPFWAVQLRKIGQGEEPHFFTHQRATPHMKTIGRSLTCWQVWDNELAIKRVLYNLTEEVMYKVRKLGLAGRWVYISLRGKDRAGQVQYWRQHFLAPHPIRHASEMFDIIYNQLYQSWQRQFPVIKCSVRLGELKPWAEFQPVLWPSWHKQEQVATALDKITQKYGLFTVQSGAMMGAPPIRPEVTGFLGDRDYQLSRLS